ncbi:universal stress protein, UspA family [Formosa agariphila KMM 3901]|uniref:Universal stress protein, UspA family n=1 Tax=Formosa agariphila (strain DSM 15362 / KCTC 12365 / LMG 23005 / KMM 3901 / M-2Alg 35-1) TaxID=1347342 RepID=T2KHP4_FORAG|nr:universal stress protein [Formosa agariphila]CDF77928.1 universal stress protein, UspA family [Formosa agariphila KMM 3901]
MKRILVPTDFSKEAEFATKIAAQFANKFNCEIYFLHIIDLPTGEVDQINTPPSEIPEALFFMKLASKRFDELLNADYLEGITVHHSIKTNSTFTGINETAKELNIDMIIMGSHGATGFKEIFIGSNTEKVVRTSKVPVLVIKSSEKEFKVNNLVFASDFLIDSIHTYEQAVKFAKKFNSKIHLLLVNTPNNFSTSANASKRIQSFIDSSDYTNYTINIHNDDTVEKGILNFSEQIDADIIGISTHGRQGIAHFFNGSISEDIVNHAIRPVITFKI